MTLRTEIEIWNKYGAYLIGVTGISAKHKGVSFETFYNNLDGSTGGWRVPWESNSLVLL